MDSHCRRVGFQSVLRHVRHRAFRPDPAHADRDRTRQNRQLGVLKFEHCRRVNRRSLSRTCGNFDPDSHVHVHCHGNAIPNIVTHCYADALRSNKNAYKARGTSADDRASSYRDAYRQAHRQAYEYRNNCCANYRHTDFSGTTHRYARSRTVKHTGTPNRAAICNANSIALV